MRTTVTLDPDVAAKLKEETAVRHLLQGGAQLERASRPGERRAHGGKPYKVRTSQDGRRPGVNLDKALQLAGELEDEEILRKMALRK